MQRTKLKIKTVPVILAAAITVVAMTKATAASALINPGFESAVPGLAPANYTYVNAANVNGWSTTASDSLIEIWSSGFAPEGTVFYSATGNGVWDGGNQFAEINATQAATLYQEVDITDAGPLSLYFLHRGRASASVEDVLNVTVTYLGGSNPEVVWDQNFGATNERWILHEAYDVYDVTPDRLGVYRFAYSAVSSAGGNNSYGNFIDNASFGVNLAPVPEPSGVLLISLLGSLTLLRRGRAA